MKTIQEVAEHLQQEGLRFDIKFLSSDPEEQFDSIVEAVHEQCDRYDAEDLMETIKQSEYGAWAHAQDWYQYV